MCRNIENIIDIVRGTIRRHPRECVFERGAAQKVAMEMLVHFHLPTEEFINELALAIKAREIYCPHEGIDRRAKVGQGAKA